MVAPIDYSLPGVQSPFQAFLQAAQAGAGLSQAQLQRQQFEAQMAQQQQEAAAKSAQQTEIQQLQAVPMEQMTQPQMLRLAQLTGSEATRAYLFRAAERIPAERQTGLARNYGSTILALVRNPQIGVKRLETLAEAEQDPEQKKALTALIETAKVDPLAAAKWGVDMMDMGGGKFSEVGQALRKALGAEFGVEGAPVKLSRGDVLVTPTGRQIAAGLPMEPATPSEIQQYELAKREGFKGTFFDFKRQIAEAGRTPPAPRQMEPIDPARAAFREVDAAGNVTFFNAYGQPIRSQAGAAKPTATFEKTTAQRKQLVTDLDRTITELEDAAKPKGLIEQSTGSGAGRLVDVGAAFIGQATPGAIAIGRLQPIADMVLKMVPRFEGPQSDKDTRTYKEAAGQLADATLPTEIRQQAAKEIVRLMKARKNQFVTQEMAAEGAAPAGAAPAAAPAAPRRREIAPGVFVTERP
jgi:hypothetical protein